FAHVISRMQRWQRSSVTSIRSAMADGEALIRSDAYDGVRRVIDISGDGADNSSLDLETVRQAVGAAGTTVNGLAIEDEDSGLTVYYRDHVITGAGSFVRSEEHTSELQSLRHLVCRLLLEKKNIYPQFVC